MHARRIPHYAIYNQLLMVVQGFSRSTKTKQFLLDAFATFRRDANSSSQIRSDSWRSYMLKRQIAFLVVVILLPVLSFAQESEADQKEKAQKRAALVEQILADIPNLKLAENRAIAYARIGSVTWNLDQKRAHSLYQNAVNDLFNAQILAESNRRTNANQNELLTGGSTRPQVLNAIASHDAEFALEALAKTRPSAIAKAMSPQPQTDKISDGSGNNIYLAQNERNMEQSFLRMAADQNPERAEKLIKDALAKGLSNETLSLLRKLADRNSSEAADLATQVVDKLLHTEMTLNGQPNYQSNQMMVSILNDYMTNQQSGSALKFDDSQMRSIARKLISYYLERGSRDGNWLTYSITPIAEKFDPSMVERLKNMAKDFGCGGRGLCSENGYDPDVQKLLSNGETTAEQMIAAAKKAPINQRRQLYAIAANKLVEQGNVAAARDLLSENFSDESLDQVMQGLDNQYSYHLINQGRFEDAERLIDSLPESSQLSSLINLANAAYQRDPEKNKTYAVSLIRKARDLVGEPPENSSEFQYLIQIVSALTNIDIREAFQIYESLVPQMNELSNAAAVINGFQNSSQVRSGEFILSEGNSFGFYADYSPLRSFLGSDFDRTMKIVDGFNRREIRISLKLQLAEGS